MLCKINYFLYVYFTPYPQHIYKKANNSGCVVLSGVGLGLIHSQIAFWVANCITLPSLITIIENNYNFELTHVNVSIFTFCTFLYTASIMKTNYLYKFLYLK